jgi:hypothetical protein
MADFGRLLATVDSALGTGALAAFMEQRDQIAADVVSGDPIAGALQSIAECEGDWTGSLGELKGKLDVRLGDSKVAPRNERAVSGAIKRNISVLRSVGVEVEILPRASHKSKTMVRLLQLGASGGTSTLDDVPPPNRRSGPPKGPSGARGARNGNSNPVLDFQQEIEEKHAKSPDGEQDIEVSDVPHVLHVPQDSVHELLPETCPDCGTTHPQGAVFLTRCLRCWGRRDEELLVGV